MQFFRIIIVLEKSVGSKLKNKTVLGEKVKSFYPESHGA
jgi:hypothetical protein